jgi:hypothetical protein
MARNDPRDLDADGRIILKSTSEKTRSEHVTT